MKTVGGKEAMTRILLVEDDERMARFVELELAHEGYTVLKAADGRTGLTMALNDRPDLVLLDILLPGLNGLEVLRRIRRESPLGVSHSDNHRASHAEARGPVRVPDPHLHTPRRGGGGHLRWLRHNCRGRAEHGPPLRLL